MRLKLPPRVAMIINMLELHGYEAYAVGGCVRDSILARQPDDWDITTSAQPDEIKQTFSRTIDTGIEHGTVTVLFDGGSFEVTTFRVDGDYKDNRHPSEVTFTASLEEDLLRRDFTINAMAYNDKKGLIDLYGGMRDLQKRTIRCVGKPEDRFSEDALRMMRAVRLAAQLGFVIEKDTLSSISRLAGNIQAVSAERIQVELVKLITSDNPEMFVILYETGLSPYIIPGFDDCMRCRQNTPHHRYTVGEHTLVAMHAIEADKVLRLTMLLHDIGKPRVRTTDETGRDHFKGHAAISEEKAKKILTSLRFDNDTIWKVTRLIRYHDYRPEPDAKSVRRAIYKISPELFPLYIKVQRADTTAKSDYHQEEKFHRIDEVETRFHQIMRDGHCISLKQLAITGQDLIGIGIKPGPQIGAILNAALLRVIDNQALNDRKFLLDFAKYENAKR